MSPQWAETDTQSLSKIKIRKTMPENTHIWLGVDSEEISSLRAVSYTSEPRHAEWFPSE